MLALHDDNMSLLYLEPGELPQSGQKYTYIYVKFILTEAKLKFIIVAIQVSISHVGREQKRKWRYQVQTNYMQPKYVDRDRRKRSTE